MKARIVHSHAVRAGHVRLPTPGGDDVHVGAGPCVRGGRTLGGVEADHDVGGVNQVAFRRALNDRWPVSDHNDARTGRQGR